MALLGFPGGSVFDAGIIATIVVAPISVGIEALVMLPSTVVDACESRPGSIQRIAIGIVEHAPHDTEWMDFASMLIEGREIFPVSELATEGEDVLLTLIHNVDVVCEVSIHVFHGSGNVTERSHGDLDE